MLVDFTMPDLDLGDEPVAVSLWLVEVGSSFLEGDRLLEIAADGVTVDLPAPTAGKLRTLFVYEDDRLRPGMKLATIDTEA
ncbi:MAG: lipoyl domain-containing protein [Planctomycetaceae bacterium]|nr:lipoyl domain-containing protein [Planctomycetaceae bacterium]